MVKEAERGSSKQDSAASRPGRPSLPSIPEMREPAFMDEARTMEVFVRSNEPATAPSMARAERALLLRMDGVQAGSVIAVDHLPCTVGRHPTNTLRIDEDSISRHHARIVRDDQGFWVEDLGSRNGSFVGGERIQRQRLQDGAWITFGTQVSFRFTVTDLREERLLRRLYESSTRDALTGAYNRAHFDERLRSEIAFAARHKTEASLVLLDIDHFKRVNDTYGHQAGDMVLKELVTLSQRSLRTEDVFARFGGEEFGVILRGINLRGASRLGERLRMALELTPLEFEGATIKVTLSAGCASMACCSEPATPDEIIRVADRRLYAAKSGGRNRVISEG
ncbi:MAG: GGDEF domain-containing protein [Polyangiaceae bacterium]